MRTTDRRPDSLLPAAFHSATMLWWLWLLPETVLFALNLRNFFLVNGEMTLAQITLAGYLGAAGLGLLVFGCLTLLVLRLLRRPIPWGLSWPILVTHIAYLWWFTASLGKLLPGSVTVWILPETRVLYQQFALIMPALFYAMLRIACFPVPWARGRDIALSAGSVAAVFLPWACTFRWINRPDLYPTYLACVLSLTAVLLPFVLAARARLQERWRRALTIGLTTIWAAATGLVFVGLESHWTGSADREWLVLGVFVVLAAGALIHILRLLVHLEVWMQERGGAGRMAFAGLIGLAGPIGGLLLNRAIPFPADYQCAPIYALAVVNGLLLVFPMVRSTRTNLVVWLLQAMMFPFTFYFLLVFMPFLPLSVLAILAAGAGFLVLVPMALFIVHGRRILEGLRLAQVAWGSRVAKLALAAALAALPLLLTAAALLDRAGLHQAIGYVFEPAYEDGGFAGSPALVRRTLGRMMNARDGRQLPFLSGCYNRIVFGGLVLPDDKLRRMQAVFFGDLLPRRTQAGMLDDLLGRPRRGIMQELAGGPDQLRPFSGSAAKLSEVGQHSELEAGGVRSLLTLKMANEQSSRSEFKAPLELPDGVLVSGLWLYMDKERVAGQLFEKKTAMWVYHMITSERRDPALLICTGPGAAELCVFPFEPGQERTVEIELLRPAGRATEVRIGGRTVQLPALGSPAGLTLAPARDGTGSLLIPAGALPAITRKPYLHFIVDQSAAAAADPLSLVQAAAARFEGITNCVVTLANYEFDEPAGLEPRPLGEVTALLASPQANALPRRGGFCRDRAIQRALLLRARRLDDPAAADAERLAAPIFVVLQSAHPPAEGEAGSLAWFKDMAPDFPRFYVFSGTDVSLCPFEGTPQAAPSFSPAFVPVSLLRWGAQCAALAPSTELIHMDRVGADPNPPLRVYQPDAGRFAAWPQAEALPEGSYGKGLAAWGRFMRLQHDPSQSPSLWPEVVRTSRDCGVMVPSTAWIVVENSAQWKMLAMKEKQKLNNSESLDFQTVPEPGTTSLALLGALILGAGWMRRQRAIAP
jgi:hypothetical protein